MQFIWRLLSWWSVKEALFGSCIVWVMHVCLCAFIQQEEDYEVLSAPLVTITMARIPSIAVI